MTADRAPRRTLYIPPDLWDRIQQAARKESVRRNETVSASQYIREAVEARMEQEAHDGEG